MNSSRNQFGANTKLKRIILTSHCMRKYNTQADLNVNNYKLNLPSNGFRTTRNLSNSVKHSKTIIGRQAKTNTFKRPNSIQNIIFLKNFTKTIEEQNNLIKQKIKEYERCKKIKYNLLFFLGKD